MSGIATVPVPLSRLFSPDDLSTRSAAAVVLVTSRTGAVSVFSSAEISSGGPSLDVSGAAPRLVAPAPRALEDVVSVELRVLSP